MSLITNPTLSSPLSVGPLERYHYTIAEADVDFIRCILPKRNTLAHVLNHLLQGFIAECKAYGITDASRRDDFIRAVNTIRVSFDRPALEGVDRSTVVNPQRRPTSPESAILEGETSLNAEPKVVYRKRIGGRGSGANSKDTKNT